jgi:methionyl-tRNA formyltransferase
MNLALFAARDVGIEIARFLSDQSEDLKCLVLDANDRGEANSTIRQLSRVASDCVLSSNTIYEEGTLARMSLMGIDLIILAWWPYIIRPSVLAIPRVGCLNLHPSLLPYDRGKHYNFWTLVEDSPFGVTIHFVDPGVDTGDIAWQSQIPKSWEDTGKSLYEKAQQEIVRLFKNNFADIKNGNIPRTPQDRQQGSSHFAREIESASRIDLDRSYTARDLLNLLRARTFPPHPACRFTSGDATYEVRVDIRRITDER